MEETWGEHFQEVGLGDWDWKARLVQRDPVVLLDVLPQRGLAQGVAGRGLLSKLRSLSQVLLNASANQPLDW